MNHLIDMVATLTYINYSANRVAAPDITPQSWEKIYGPDVEWMEERFQQEKAGKESAYVSARIDKDRRQWRDRSDFDRSPRGGLLQPGS